MSDNKDGMNYVLVRPMVTPDVPAFLALVEALAAYEKLPPPDAEARERLARDATADPPRFFVLLAELGGQVVGYAVFFETYSTFLARPTLYIEDIFVLEEERLKGVGTELMRELAREAVRRGCGRMEWQVLDWNVSAKSFYDRLGAGRLAEWQPYRLTRAQFESLAELD